jgi:hypothetical protein
MSDDSLHLAPTRGLHAACGVLLSQVDATTDIARVDCHRCVAAHENGGRRIRYGITCVHKDGERRLYGPAQGRHLWDTREAAEAWLAAAMVTNGPDRLPSIMGEQSRGTFRADAFDCYAHGDPIGIYPKGDES